MILQLWSQEFVKHLVIKPKAKGRNTILTLVLEFKLLIS